MSKILRVTGLIMLSLVIMAGAVLAGCSKGQAKLKMPTIELSQYSKGTAVDFDETTINQISESGGELGFKTGTAAAIYPTMYYSTAKRDQMARAMPTIGSPYKIGDGVSATTYDNLTDGDKLAVDLAIFAGLSAAEQNVVVEVGVAGFFNRVDTDIAAAKAPADTSAYAYLKNISTTAADGWATDLASKDVADAFFTWLVKEAVLASPTSFGLPGGYTASDPECAAIGKASFTNGTAGTMYPTQSGNTASAMYPTLRDSKSSAMYGKAYADLTAAEKLAVDAAVLGDLDQQQKAAVDGAVYAALSSVFADDAARTGARDGMATYYESKGWITAGHNTYALCTGVEKAQVDQGVYGSLGVTAQERDYIDFAAVPGAILGWVSELAPALPYDQNIAYLQLKSKVTVTAANHWKADVDAGVHPRQAFYRWLSKETVSESAATAVSIQLGVAEFYLKITNPNNYEISLDKLNLIGRVKSSATGEAVAVDAAKQAITEKIWVPAKEEITVRVLAPVKTMDMITSLIMSGKTSDEARALAADVWGQIQADTADWDVSVEIVASNKSDTVPETYTLTWAAS